MPRIRTIKPSFFASEDVSALPLRARLTWIGLWTHCDDAGRAKDNVKLIKAAVWPLDNVGLADVEEDLITLADHGRIVRYAVEGQRFLEVTNWSEHQKISKRTDSRIPPPPTSPPGALPEDSRNIHGGLPEDSGEEGKGREGKGRDARAPASTTPDAPPPPPGEPPSKCPRHIGDPSPPPCGACADARRAHDAWERQRAETPTPSPPPFRSTGGAPDPDRAQRNAAAARALLRGGDGGG